MTKPAPDAVERTYAKDRDEWRAWLELHHDTASAVWLVYWKKGSGCASVSWSEAVDEALCFGWIDSKVKSLDDERYEQWFTRRRPGSVWSKINKDKVERLVGEGRMTPAGLAPIERARADGSWNALDIVDALEVPDALAEALAAAGPVAQATWDSWPASVRKPILQVLRGLKREETRQRRSEEFAASAASGTVPRFLRRPLA